MCHVNSHLCPNLVAISKMLFVHILLKRHFQENVNKPIIKDQSYKNVYITLDCKKVSKGQSCLSLLSYPITGG